MKGIVQQTRWVVSERLSICRSPSTWLTARHISTSCSSGPVLNSWSCLLLPPPTSFPSRIPLLYDRHRLLPRNLRSSSTPPYSPHLISTTFINIPWKVSPFQAHCYCSSDSPSLPLAVQNHWASLQTGSSWPPELLFLQSIPHLPVWLSFLK